MFRTMKRLIDFTGSHRKKVYLACGYSFLFSVFEVVSFLGIVLTLHYVLTLDISHDVIQWSLIGQVLLVLIGGLIGRIVFGGLSNTGFSVTCFNVCNEKRIAIGHRLKRLPMGFFHEHKLGDITAAVTTAINDIESCFYLLFTNIIVGLAYAILMTGLLLIINPPIGGIVLLALLIGLAVNRLLQKKVALYPPKDKKPNTLLSQPY